MSIMFYLNRETCITQVEREWRDTTNLLVLSHFVQSNVNSWRDDAPQHSSGCRDLLSERGLSTSFFYFAHLIVQVSSC